MADSVQIQSIRPRHEAIADWLLSNPELKRGDLARQMNVSESWLSIVINSDVFQEYWAARRTAHETTLREKIVGKQLEVTLQALDRLGDVMNDDKVDGRLVLDIAERTAARLGFEPRPSVRGKFIEERSQTFSRPVNPGTLQESRELITRKIVREQDIQGDAVGTPA